MGLQFYKANRAVSGSALGITFNSKEQAVFFECIKQTGWDEGTKNGSFKGGDKANVKFSLFEVGGLIDVIETVLATSVASDKATLVPARREFKGYHSNAKGSTQITFKEYKRGTDLVGLSLSVKKTVTEGKVETSFVMGFSFAEAVTLREYLKFTLEHAFSALYAEDKERAKAYAKKKEDEAKADNSNPL